MIDFIEGRLHLFVAIDRTSKFDLMRFELEEYRLPSCDPLDQALLQENQGNLSSVLIYERNPDILSILIRRTHVSLLHKGMKGV